MRFFEVWNSTLTVQISTVMATFAVLFAEISNRRITSPSWIHLFLVKLDAVHPFGNKPLIGELQSVGFFLSEVSQTEVSPKLNLSEPTNT